MMHREVSQGNTYILGVTETGKSHRIIGKDNQDHFAFEVVSQGFAFAISDGVGSCRSAERGSEYAVQAVLHTFRELIGGRIPFDKEVIVSNIITCWRSQIPDAKINDYCATLKYVIKYDNVFLLASLGDGYLIAAFSDEIVKAPEIESSFSNETTCLYESTSIHDFWYKTYPLNCNDENYTIFLATDGITNGITYGTDVDLVKEINYEMRSSDIKDEIYSFINEILKYSFDDKTLGIIKYEA